MEGFIGNTDHGWFTHLRARPDLDEVNFWFPGEQQAFGQVASGAPFFFKLKASHGDAIVGFGQFSRFDWMPVWLAWEVFGEANGVRSEREFLDRLRRLHRGKRRTDRIGCAFIAFPVFFAPDDWVRRPRDWKRNVVRGAVYDLTEGEGRRVWEECTTRAAAPRWTVEDVERDRHGAPVLVRPRLGQRGFRFAVLDAYDRACAVTTEHSLPVLDAAHIRPYGLGGEHAVRNGLPLRNDLHRLFDLGYVTVKPDLTVAVSRRLRDEYANGRTYYAYDGRRIQAPRAPEHRPSREALEWHGDEVFLG